MTHLTKILYIVLCTALLSACGTSKRRPRAGQVGAVESNQTALYQRLSEQQTAWTALKAKLHGELQKQDKELSARLHLQAARGQGMRLSVHVLLFEVARLWFTPTEVYFVDLVHGVYAQESYRSFGARLGVSIDYPQIEALIMGAVFAPGQGADMASLQSLRYESDALGQHRLLGKVLGYAYTFALSREGVLRSLQVHNPSGKPVFESRYISPAFSGLPAHSPETTAEYSLYDAEQEQTERLRGRLTLKWQSVDLLPDASGLSLQPVIKSKYERVDLGAVLRALK